jgi:hypothetical protein
MYRNSLLVLITFFLCFSDYAVARKSGNMEVVIYHVDWELRTRSNLSVDYVRQRYTTKIHLRSATDVQGFIDSLHIERMESYQEEFSLEDVDIRLVVDFVNADGDVKTFYASRFLLIDKDNKKKFNIDQKFRDKLSITF